MKVLHMIAYVLLWVGGINWGLIGLSFFVNGALSWNIVSMLLGNWPTAEAAVYILVGLAALWTLIGHRKDCRVCSSGM